MDKYSADDAGGIYFRVMLRVLAPSDAVSRHRYRPRRGRPLKNQLLSRGDLSEVELV